MSLAKLIASRMVGRVGNRMVGGAPAVKSETAVAPARSQAHRGGPLPRQESLPDLAAGLRALPLPPAPPDVPAAVISKGWVGSCKAICAETGRRCRLLANHTTAHSHERGPFFRIAIDPHQSFPRREAIDRAALRSNPEAT